jgi:hypothetical protein
MARASGAVRTEKIPGRSMPGNGERIDAPPVTAPAGHTSPWSSLRWTRHVRRRDADCLSVRQAVHREPLAEDASVGDEETRLVLDHPPEVIGQLTARVRDVGTVLHHEDLGLLVQPTCCTRATNDTTTDDRFHNTTTDDRFHDTITMIGGLRFTPFG